MQRTTLLGWQYQLNVIKYLHECDNCFLFLIVEICLENIFFFMFKKIFKVYFQYKTKKLLFNYCKIKPIKYLKLNNAATSWMCHKSKVDCWRRLVFVIHIFKKRLARISIFVDFDITNHKLIFISFSVCFCFLHLR